MIRSGYGVGAIPIPNTINSHFPISFVLIIISLVYAISNADGRYLIYAGV